jgi:hypothetical protein
MSTTQKNRASLSRLLDSGAVGSSTQERRKFGGSATVGGDVPDASAGESEIYIRPDGKKVRRIKKTVLREKGSSASVGGEVATSTSEVYIRPDGKRVRRIVHKSPSTASSTTSPASSTSSSNANLGSFLNEKAAAAGSTAPTNFRGSATVAGNQNDGEIYIRADGTKVRRIKKSSASVSSSTTPKAALDTDLAPRVEKFPLSSSASSASVTSATSMIDESTNSSKYTSDVYINAEGKRVRRVLKSRPASGSASVASSDGGASVPALSGFLEQQQLGGASTSQPRGSASVSGSSPTLGEVYINAEGKKVRRVVKSVPKSSASVSGDAVAPSLTMPKSNTIAEGEIYVRADGKRVRRVKRSNSNLSVQPATATTATAAPLSPPQPLNAKSLEGFLEKQSPKKATGITGSATVAGDRVSSKIDGGEIYINAQGKKVRRIRKPRPPATTHLGVTQSILQERAAKQKAVAEQETEPVSTTSTATMEDNSAIFATMVPPLIIDSTTPDDVSSMATPSSSIHPKDLVQLWDKPLAATPKAANTADAQETLPGEAASTVLTVGTSETPTAGSTTSTSPLLNNLSETSEIYINAEGKRVRRIRRSSSGISTNSGVDASGNSIPTDRTSKISEDGSQQQQQPPQLGEIYVRADGKKVRRVRRTASNDGMPSLGVFLSNDPKPKLKGSATVVGDRKLDGEIIIRPDGKRVIRRARSKMETSASLAGDSSTPMVGEIFRNAEGKLVRRVQRSSASKPTDIPSHMTASSTTVTETPAVCVTPETNIEAEESKSPASTVANALTVVLTEEEEDIAKNFRNMKNMGIPEDAVRHKMTVSEIHPKIIAAVMGEAWNKPSDDTLGSPPSPSVLSSIQLTSEEEADATVYRKMLHMGLPIDAVRHKMMVNDIAPKVVATVLGEEYREAGSDAESANKPPAAMSSSSTLALTGGEEAIAAVYRRLQKMGLSDDAIRDKMISSEVHPKIMAAVLGEAWSEEPAVESSLVARNLSTLTAEEESIAAPFQKMKSIGFPNDAVRHKMIMSEVSPKIMATILGDEAADDSQPKTEGNDVAEEEEEEAVASKYQRLLKAGIPMETVRHKMVIENVDPSVIAMVLGHQAEESVTASPNALSAEEEQIIAQYRKMQQRGLPDDAVRHKMIVNEVDPKIISIFFSPKDGKGHIIVAESSPKVGETTEARSINAAEPINPGASSVSKTSDAVAYVVVVGDDTTGNSPKTASMQSGISLHPDEKFAVKVADETDPNSSVKQTKFYTLDELARLSGQSKNELEEIIKEKRTRGLSPPKFTLQPLDEPKYEVSLPAQLGSSDSTDKYSGKQITKNVAAIKEGHEVVDSELAKAARAVTALGDGDMSKLFEKLKMGDMKDLLDKLHEAEKRQKKLEKQLAQAGVAIAEDIEYQEALGKVEQIAKRMNEIGGSDVIVADKAEQNKLREEYFKLEQEMERYNTALVLSEEYQAEQDRLELKWEADNMPYNIEALKKIRRHMPVNIRNLSEAELTKNPSPNGKYLPLEIAKKFKRTNILQCLRLNPDDLECMHPATLENMRVTGLTLTERRALYIHFKPLGPKWEKNKAEKMTERKWTWYQMMRNNFKENVAPYQRHIDQYGGPENHTCPLIGKQCPVKSDKSPNYDGDYGWTDEAEYEVSDVRKADVEDSGAKAKAEALELAKEKKANERADLLKKHYKGKLLQVSKANGSCEGMDEAMDQMENNTLRWTENMIEKDGNFLDADKKKEVSNMTDSLNEFKLKLLNFAQRSGMQMSGKKTAGGDSVDIRSSVEASLSEEVFETSVEYFSFIRMRLKQLSIVDTRCIKTIEMLDGILSELHARNLALFESRGAKRMNRSRKLKTNADLKKEIEDKKKAKDVVEVSSEDEPAGRMGPPGGGGGRGGLLDAIAGRGRGSGRGGLLDAIAGRGGGRGGLLGEIAGRGADGSDGDSGGRGDLLAAISGRGKGRGGGRGDLLSAIAGRGRGGGRGDGGRGGMLAAIAARGGGND